MIETTASIILWVVIGIASIAIDLITSNLLFVWFTVGCLASLIALILNYSFTIQLITFIGVSAVFIAIGYPLAKEALNKTVIKTPTMEEGYIGRELLMEEDIEEKSMIKLDGIYWTVKNQGEPIVKGDKVKIIGIEGNKLIIKKI
ncbi:NfeD family protein [Clostridium tetanomorphum]|uniref:NfeD family protein n=1 Tax=Clostridium tetanomorphum TaxID=1553 RepID=A0A923EBE9_CLOTT|nr:NfeD family protein [Clostridium tetanomorphum]